MLALLPRSTGPAPRSPKAAPPSSPAAPAPPPDPAPRPRKVKPKPHVHRGPFTGPSTNRTPEWLYDCRAEVAAVGLAKLPTEAREPVLRRLLDLIALHTRIAEMSAEAAAALEDATARAGAASVPTADGSWVAQALEFVREFGRCFKRQATNADAVAAEISATIDHLAETDPIASASERAFEILSAMHEASKPRDGSPAGTDRESWGAAFRAADFPWPPPRRWRFPRGIGRAAPLRPTDPTPPCAA